MMLYDEVQVNKMLKVERDIRISSQETHKVELSRIAAALGLPVESDVETIVTAASKKRGE